MASSSNAHGAGRRISTENNPSTHTRKRTLRARPSTQAMSDRMKHQQVRERQRALQSIRAGQQDWEMDEAASLAMAIDPWAGENSIPVFEGVTFPRQLARAPFRMSRPEALAAVDPGLADTNIEYIKDCMELRGEQMYASLRNTAILALHKPHGQQYFPTSARVRVKHAHADLPTHLLAVRSSLPGGRDFADEPSSSFPASSPNASRPSAHYTPIHALTLAVYAPLLPGLPPSDPSLQLPNDSDSDSDMHEGTAGAELSVDITLPVVVLRVPSPRTLGMLIAVLYSQRYDNLVKVLLGIPLLPTPSSSPDPSTPGRKKTQSSLFTQSIFSQLFSPLSVLPSSSFSNNVPTSPTSPTRSAARHMRLTARLTHMSRLLAFGYLNAFSVPPTPSLDKDKLPDSSPQNVNANSHAARALLHRTRLVQALAANARALGVCDLAFWGAIDVAWAVLLGALGFVAGSATAATSVPEEDDGEDSGTETPKASTVDVMDAVPA